MNNFSVGIRLIAGFVFVSLLTLITAGSGYLAIENASESLRHSNEEMLPAVAHTGSIELAMRSIVVAQRTLMMDRLSRADRDRQREDIRLSREVIAKSRGAMDRLRQSPAVHEQWSAFVTTLDAVRTLNDEALAAIQEWEGDMADQGRMDRAAELVTGKGVQANTRLAEAAAAVQEAVRAEARAARIQNATEARTANNTAIALAVGAPLLSLLLGFLISRSITRPLGGAVSFAQLVAGGNLNADLAVRGRDEIGRLADALRVMVDTLKAKIAEAEDKSEQAASKEQEALAAMREAEEARKQAENAKREGMLQAAAQVEGAVEVVSSASEELSAQIEQADRGAEEQAKRVSETATAMEEMNASVLEVARNAGDTAEVSDAARAKAADGAALVERVVGTIDDVRRQSLDLKADMEDLGRQAESIGTIMNVISDIADQTNLLALNAAIEAARAGDAGRGFAVVADEVRKLAEKTMQATVQVGEAIRGVQQGTRKNMENVDRSVQGIEESTQLVRQSGEALGEIVRLVETASDQVRSIATASEQQSSASEEINHAVEQISTISGETAQAMRESARAVSALAEQAQVLKRLVDEMKTA
ncbi:HAMP domain-containing protein [Desulfovibrio oxamicus]|uniref:HAMP domain-containing protein n=1 Tax=Nitratidesulfovibrio oxamicus TaxID=32016 RepID=A0ABS0J031_9BACT|nr:methyl-accepting chemotaxis protein [Nitratidesulfovibrio oxamicus]MBG3875793.1 HAMP domain-containing protein [Nitratidesulfovibrio oxamicus]